MEIIQNNLIDYFIVCHDQNIIIDQINNKKYENLPGHKFLFVGNSAHELIENFPNVVICKNLPFNIEESKELLTFTAWYAIANNNVLKSNYVCILEYDIELKENFHNKNLENLEITDIVAYHRSPIDHIEFKRSSPWIDILVRQIFNSNNVDEFIKNHDFWYPTTNCLFKKSIFYEFNDWFYKQSEQFKNHKYASYAHERMITVFAILSKHSIKYIKNALIHNQKCSHNFKDVLQKYEKINLKINLEAFYKQELEELVWFIDVEKDFDEKFYYNNYEDIRSWYIGDTSKTLRQRMFHHYFLYGKSEKRQGNLNITNNKNNLLQKIDLVCFYTESHEKLLFEYLIPSLKKDNGFNLVLLKGEQMCKTAAFYEDGWFETVSQKILSLMSYLENLKEETVFVFTDPDVILLQECSKRLIEIMNEHNKDILLQDDQSSGGCTGFFIAKKTEKLMLLLNSVVNIIKEKSIGDQASLNLLLKTGYFDVSFGLLPKNEFSNYGVFVESVIFNTDKRTFKVPPEVRVFHGNRCKGLSYKYELLDYVKNSNC